MQRTDCEPTGSNPRQKSRVIQFVLGILFLFSVVFGASFVMRTPQERPHAFSNLPVKTVTIPIEGLTCASCVARVKKTLQSLEGVAEVEVNLARRNARVRYLEAQVSPERLAAAINDLGYTAGTPTAGGTQ